jgi:hypothetical protein
MRAGALTGSARMTTPFYYKPVPQSNCVCLSSLSSRNLRRAPSFLLSDHRVEDDQELLKFFISFAEVDSSR